MLNNLGILDSGRNQLKDARTEHDEALKIFRELAQQDPETYSAYVAATLNQLGMLDRNQNKVEEALKTYRELAQKDPERFLPRVALTLNNLGILYSNQSRMEEARNQYEEALKITERRHRVIPGPICLTWR
jgi:tetratricopeptide (TPR) repeat protein